MQLGSEVQRVLHIASQDIVHDLKRKLLYRVVDADSVLNDLFQRLAQDDEIFRLYVTGRSFTPEITRQAHYAFFEQVYGLLKNRQQQKQVYEELARYFYKRAIVYLYELVSQSDGSGQLLARLEFKRLARESSQTAVAQIHRRITWSGDLANPSHFYSYASRTIRKQCLAVLAQEGIDPSILRKRKELALPPSPDAYEHMYKWPPVLGQTMIQSAKWESCLTGLVEVVGRFASQAHRDVAALLMAGLDHRQIANTMNKSEQEVAASLSRILGDWGNDLALREKLKVCLELAD